MCFQTQNLNHPQQLPLVVKNFKKYIYCLVFIITILIIYLLFIIKMNNDNFYITLPSNVRRTNPDQIANTVGNYITHLGTKLNLSNDWECALSEISYTFSFYNIIQDETIELIDEFNNTFVIEETL